MPFVLVAVLAGCAVPADAPSNPLNDLEKVIDLIPWAKSVAAEATAEQVTARIAEATAGLPSLDIPEATRSEIESRLTALSAAVSADPGKMAAHANELNAILDEIKAAVQQP